MKILFLCTTDSMIWNFMIPHIRKLENEGHIIECACCVTGVYFNELQKQGLIMHEIPFKRSPYNLQNIKAYFDLCILVRNIRYDCIFCHEPVGGAFGRIVGKKYGCKVVYMAHGFHFFKGARLSNKLIYYTVERFLSYWTDLLITINKEDYEASKKFHAKQVTLLNGIGVDTFKFKVFESHFLEDKFFLTKNCLKLLSVGELIDRKNHISIIEVMKYYRGQNVHYFIAGEGEKYDFLRRKVEVYQLQDQIHFLGFCRNISELCNSCDVFIFPSLQEGLSLALMEAMSCGKPIIASRIRGNVDLINENKGGFLVDVKDILGYKRAINKIIENPELKKLMGTENQNNVKKFDINLVEDKIVNALTK